MNYSFSFNKKSKLSGSKPIFLTQNYIEQSNAIYISVYEDDQAISELAILIKPKFFIKKAQLIYQPYPINNQVMMDELLLFLKDSRQVDFLLPTPNYLPFEFAPQKSIFCPFGSYQINLMQEKECIFNAMHKKVRQTIRKSQRNGLTILSNKKSLVDGYQVIEATFLKSGLAPPNYQKLEGMVNNNLVKCWSVYFEGRVQATLLVLIGKRGSYTYYTGTIDNAFAGAINFLYYFVILEIKDQGGIFFDFSGARINPKEGSKQEGIQKFKERFGATMLQGFMWKVVFNTFKYKLYVLLLKIYTFKNKHKYQKDIIDQELIS
jgi:hypothetical protein